MSVSEERAERAWKSPVEGLEPYRLGQVSPGGEYREEIQGVKTQPGQPVASPLKALALYFVAVLIFLTVGPLLITPWKLAGLIPVQILALLVPSAIYLRLTRTPVQEALPIRRVSGQALLGAALLGCTVWYLLLSLLLPLQEMLMPVPDAFMAQREQLFAVPQSFGGWFVLWVAGALTPSICEEVLFRGVLLHSVRTRLSPWHAILVVSVLFSLFHFNPYQLSITLVQGVVMGWLLVRTRSLLGSITFHLFNNSIVLALSYYESADLPPWLIPVMAGGALLGAFLVTRASPGRLFEADTDTASR